MKLTKKTSAIALAGSAAALLTTYAIAQSTGAKVSADTKGKCHGINACKAKSECATATTSCSGQNACKGKGWVMKTKAECDAEKGEFEPFK